MSTRTTNIHVKDSADAFNVAARFMPGDWDEDTQSSARAGYPVYRCYGDGLYYNYICDLGNRLEVNLGDGSTVNVWIDDDAEEDFTAAPAAAADGDGLQGSGVNSAEGSAAAGADSVQSSETGAAAPAVQVADDPGAAGFVWDDNGDPVQEVPAVRCYDLNSAGLNADDLRGLTLYEIARLMEEECDGKARVTVAMRSVKTGVVRSFDSFMDFLDDWAFFYSADDAGSDRVMMGDDLRRVLVSLVGLGHGARVSFPACGFDLVFTWFRFPDRDRFMQRFEEVA